MIAEKGKYGQWVVSAVVNGVRVHRQYFGYTKREAVSIFRKEVGYDGKKE